MGDVMPDYHVETQRLRVQLSTLQANMERYKLEIMEMKSKERKAYENMEVTTKAILETTERIDGLIETHGEAPPIEGE